MPSVRLRLEHLYLVAALAVAGFVVALIPIGPHDFWWHMAIGRDIARSGNIPATDSYSWSLPPGTPFFYQSWLSELILYWTYDAGGMQAIVTLRNLMFTAACAILAAGAWRRSGSWRLAALAVAGFTLQVLNNIDMRPQSFSWVPFALFSTLLAGYRHQRLRGRTLVLLPVVMLFWVNLHGAFILGIILVGLTAAGETAKRLMRRPDAPTWPAVRRLWLLVGLTTLAPAANPKGFAVFGYVVKLLTDPPSQGLVIEWQPIDVTSFLGICFAISVLLAAWSWTRSRKQVDLTDSLIWAGFLWIALSGVRYIIWWAMVSWPIVAGLLGERVSSRRNRPAFANTSLALVICLLPLVIQPPFKGRWSLPAAFGGLDATVQDGALIQAGTPVQAAEWLRANPLPTNARLVHDMGFGSYLIWALPRNRVYVDPRVELYPLAEWLRYKRIMAGCNYNRELEELGATHLMLNQTAQSELISTIQQDRAWRQLYQDDQAIIFARTAAGISDEHCTSLY